MHCSTSNFFHRVRADQGSTRTSALDYTLWTFYNLQMPMNIQTCGSLEWGRRPELLEKTLRDHRENVQAMSQFGVHLGSLALWVSSSAVLYCIEPYCIALYCIAPLFWHRVPPSMLESYPLNPSETVNGDVSLERWHYNMFSVMKHQDRSCFQQQYQKPALMHHLRSWRHPKKLHGRIVIQNVTTNYMERLQSRAWSEQQGDFYEHL